MDAVFRTEKAIFNYRVVGVWIENNHVLLHKQVNDENWSLPGGRVALLEDSKTSLEREMQEELGQHVQVNDLLWITENFFKLNSQPFHEIGFYYRISLVERASFFREEAFYGLEGDRLIYKWIPIQDLEDMVLYPEFLKTALKDIPHNPEHLIIRQ